jgi:glycosyltransferase involved in cell wall biosynthesis
MRASIIIPTCDEGANLGKTVQSCLETTPNLDVEVIVADDASTDGSPEEVKRRFPKVRLARHAARRGVSQTKDFGARWARGDLLVFLDAHCKPEPGAVERLVADVEELGGEAVVSPAIANLDVASWKIDPDQVGHGYAVSLETFEIWWLPLEAMPPHAGTRFRAQPTFIGCVAAMSRRLYDRLWGFDTGMLVYGSEDIDFGVRAWLMGHPVLHDLEPVVGHRFRAEVEGQVLPWEQLLANQLRMARKIFSDPVWFDWLDRHSVRQPAGLWEAGWQQYLAGNESLERERAYLMANRRYDEFWYARTFEQRWPQTPFQAGPRPRGPGPSSAAVGGAAHSLAPQLAAAPFAQAARQGHYSLSPAPFRTLSPPPFRTLSPPPFRTLSPPPFRTLSPPPFRTLSPPPRKGALSLSPAPRRKS